MSKVLYARISDNAHAYVTGLSERSGLSITSITDAILSEASKRGWGVESKPHLITETVMSDDDAST